MKKGKIVTTFRLKGRRLGRVLGGLEAEVMEVLWRRGTASIREVWDEVKVRHPVAFNTVMTVMNRLVDKRLLRRNDRRGNYRYSPRVDRQAFLASVSHDVAAALVHEFGDVAVAQFVEVLQEVDPEKLAALERLIQERRSKRS
ncbi:MAG: BlaI/MecI/CopY family transcriptional regulator [bacterium]